MSYYICYANEDRIKAIKLCNELIKSGKKAVMVDRGDTALLVDPIDNIRNAIVQCSCFVLIHSCYFSTKFYFLLLVITSSK